jgi:hypothetical protein
MWAGEFTTEDAEDPLLKLAVLTGESDLISTGVWGLEGEVRGLLMETGFAAGEVGAV